MIATANAPCSEQKVARQAGKRSPLYILPSRAGMTSVSVSAEKGKREVFYCLIVLNNAIMNNSNTTIFIYMRVSIFIEGAPWVHECVIWRYVL
jgi:hypothetical protein